MIVSAVDKRDSYAGTSGDRTANLIREYEVHPDQIKR